MPDNSDVYRSVHTHRPDAVTLRESDEVAEDDGMMELRLPIASTGDVRNEGDDPLSADELRGMATQVDSLTRGVFPEHGMSDAIDRDQYSQFEKLGYWAAADIQQEASADGEDLLMATARMPDPETLPAATGDYREALAILKEQAKRGVPIGSSIGWRDDDSAPGGVDLMEASIVGIGADPRTVSEGGEQLVARAAIEAGADPDDLVAEVRAIARDYEDEDAAPDEGRPLGPPGDRDRFESFEECVDTLSEDDDVSREDAEQICGAWEQASASDAPEDTHDMTEDDDAGEDAGTTEAQHADDGEDTQDRESEGEQEDTEQDRADGECPECGHGTREDANYCSECGEDLREDDADEDDDDMDEEDDDEEEQSADTEGDEGRAADLADRLDSLESDIEAIRNGEADIEDPTPDADAEQSADEDADTEQRDADDQGDNDGSTLRDEWLTN